jgi:hypothetical protein
MPPRPNRDARPLINYSELGKTKIVEDERKHSKIIRSKRFAPNNFTRMKGDAVTLEWTMKTGMREPFIIEEPEGLHMQMPSQSITVDQIADACGRDRDVEAMEVLTQQEKKMTLDEWAEYFGTPPEKRKQLLNVCIKMTRMVISMLRLITNT